MLKTILIDDEPKALDSLAWELENFCDQIEVLEKFTEPEKALEFIKNNHIDCVFLDIEMPTMDGFQFLNKVEVKDFAVIITTAYNEYAIKAIKQQAIDYLLKPVDIDDLTLAIQKVKHHVNRSTVVSDKLERILKDYSKQVSDKKITVNTDGKLIFLNISDIVFAESDGNYSTFHLTNSKKILLTKKLKEVNELLPKDHFFRIHNSYIVNLDKIKEYIKSEGYVVLEGNYKIPISRMKRTEFLKKI
ncbi:LytTR family DNA-binding domain-containing protein [Winogradskyella sp.]|jgi:two-component system LytT family response regulator|uniref:LytR/AlgR family response regulator transcription factor n=1 Tax=Winogradskyella sp. TaxID=1883156 RepID=UPI0025F7D765|nr:LytTR family DNA-binding domain-containing protein [Winogradskyella sp.]MCT4630281.1 LytTR family DNA-binding domain-containing protein [Winogradskyella sp.]